MQVYTNYASYCSLLFFTSSKVFVYFFSFFSSMFQPGPSLHLEVASASTKGFRAGSVACPAHNACPEPLCASGRHLQTKAQTGLKHRGKEGKEIDEHLRRSEEQ